MGNKILLISARSLFIAGILLFATAIFLLNYNRSALSTLKAQRALLDEELNEKYRISPVDKPFDFSDLVPKPAKPPETADTAEKERYEQQLQEYENLVKQEQENYETAQKTYNQTVREQEYRKKLNTYHKSKEAYKLLAQKRDLDARIDLQETLGAMVSDKYTLQFIGTILILLGAAGILILGENWERAALLVFLGFAFKTVVGL